MEFRRFRKRDPEESNNESAPHGAADAPVVLLENLFIRTVAGRRESQRGGVSSRFIGVSSRFAAESSGLFGRETSPRIGGESREGSNS